MNRILVGRVQDDDKRPRFQETWFLGVIGGGGEGDSTASRWHATPSWRILGESAVDDHEANTRELQLTLAQRRTVDCRTLGCKTCENTQYHKGWHLTECRARILRETVPDTMWPATATQRLLDTGADDALAAKDHDAKRQRREQEEPMQQEPSSGSGRKPSPSDDEAMRRADAEAEKCLKRARVLEERRAAKRASATSAQEMEESLDPATRTSSAAALMVVAEAVLAGTRETLEALTVSALQKTLAVIHRAEATAEGFCQAHKDMAVTTREKARKKQLDFLESVQIFEEVYAGDVPLETRVVSGRRRETMKTPTFWKARWTVRGYEEPLDSDEGNFIATATIQGVRMVFSRCVDMRDKENEAFAGDYTRAFSQR